MKKITKILLPIAGVAAAAAPMITLVSCGNEFEKTLSYNDNEKCYQTNQFNAKANEYTFTVTVIDTNKVVCVFSLHGTGITDQAKITKIEYSTKRVGGGDVSGVLKQITKECAWKGAWATQDIDTPYSIISKKGDSVIFKVTVAEAKQNVKACCYDTVN